MAGVSYYTRGTLAVYFPEDKVCCMNCHLARRMEKDIYKCPYTGQLNFNPAFSIQE